MVLFSVQLLYKGFHKCGSPDNSMCHTIKASSYFLNNIKLLITVFSEIKICGIHRYPANPAPLWGTGWEPSWTLAYSVMCIMGSRSVLKKWSPSKLEQTIPTEVFCGFPVPPGKFQDNILNYAKTASFYIISKFIIHYNLII